MTISRIKYCETQQNVEDRCQTGLEQRPVLFHLRSLLLFLFLNHFTLVFISQDIKPFDTILRGFKGPKHDSVSKCH